ncbi:hypothetical protein M569_06692, partial [Genlisea aurea]
GLDLFDHRVTSMDSDCGSLPPSGNSDPNFGFAFNDVNFSDRVLRLDIVSDPMDRESESEDGVTVAGWASRRRRLTTFLDAVHFPYLNQTRTHSFSALDTKNVPEERIFDVESDAGHILGIDDNDDINFQPAQPSMLDDDTMDGDESNCSEDGTKVLRVETLHISSLILAAKSPFFYKLFSNGMKESEQRHVSLRVHVSEEAAVMELINFMYTNTLSSNTAPALLSLLMAADKFEVASCVKHCCRFLKNLPMTPESALLYLDLPSNVLMADAVKPLADVAKKFLATHYKDMLKHQDEVMNLSLAGIEAILSSDDLQVASEDAVYDFTLKWARSHFPKLEDRQNILSSCLGRYIRFPCMTARKLRKALSCPDFDQDFVTKAVLDALFFKAEAPYRQRTQSSTAAEAPSSSSSSSSSSSTGHRYTERDYKYRSVKLVEFKLPRPQCVVYLDLKREECGNLFPSGRVYSQAFHLCGQGFFLSAHCNLDQQNSFQCFGLFLGMQEKGGSLSFAVEYEFSARTKATEEFVSKYKGNYTFTGGKAVGYRNLFSMPWNSFMAEDSNYFINGILHLRAELTIKKEL